MSDHYGSSGKLSTAAIVRSMTGGEAPAHDCGETPCLHGLAEAIGTSEEFPLTTRQEYLGQPRTEQLIQDMNATTAREVANARIEDAARPWDPNWPIQSPLTYIESIPFGKVREGDPVQIIPSPFDMPLAQLILIEHRLRELAKNPTPSCIGVRQAAEDVRWVYTQIVVLQRGIEGGKP